MRLRPATPLTFFFLVAFVLLLLSTLSTPVIKSIPLGSYGDTDYGVFGWCNSTYCLPVTIGYQIPDLSSTNFSTTSRHTLSSILIVHPVAAFMTLVCAILAGASHFRAPSHSPRYLLFLLILTFPTLLISLLAFLVDILLLIPHMRWGGWIVLAATIIITICSVLTCAMRRTLVSRKARKRRIAENAEMNGDNFYAMQAAQQQPQYPRAESPPPMEVSNGPNNANKLPQFAAFQVDNRRPNLDERTPPSAREPSETTRSNLAQRDIPQPPSRIQTRNDTPRTAGVNSPQSEALAGAATFGAVAGPSGLARTQTRVEAVSPIDETPPEPRVRRQPTRPRPPPGPSSGDLDGMPPQNGQMLAGNGGPRDPRDQQSQPPSYGRGRGGFPPPRGSYPPRGFPPRGGYGRDGPRNMPPPGWNGALRGMPPRGMMRGRGPPPGYPRRPMPGNRPQGNGAEFEGGAPIPMPYPPTSPSGESRDWAPPSQRYSEENPRLPDGEPFAINAPYPVRSTSERAQWRGPERRSLESSNRPVQDTRQVASDQRTAQPPYGFTRPPEAPYRGDSGLDAAELAVTNSRGPAAPQGLTYGRQSSDEQRNPGSYGYGSMQPNTGRNEPASSLPTSVSAPPSDPYAAPSTRAVEMDGSNNQPAAAELESQAQIRGAELDSRELGPQAPLGDHTHGTYLPRNLWQPDPVELGDSSPRATKPAPYTSPIAIQFAAELPERASPPGNTVGEAAMPTTERSRPQYHPVRSPSDAYVEDVEPRFASDVPDVSAFRLPPIAHVSEPLITRNPQDPSSNLFAPEPLPLDPSNRSDNRSPTHSEASNFTSISQRQINPNWRPGAGPGAGPAGLRGGPPPQRFQPDVLATNPDFSLAGAPPFARRPVGGGMPPRGRGEALPRAASYGSHHYYDGV